MKGKLELHVLIKVLCSIRVPGVRTTPTPASLSQATRGAPTRRRLTSSTVAAAIAGDHPGGGGGPRQSRSWLGSPSFLPIPPSLTFEPYPDAYCRRRIRHLPRWIGTSLARSGVPLGGSAASPRVCGSARWAGFVASARPGALCLAAPLSGCAVGGGRGYAVTASARVGAACRHPLVTAL